LAAFAASAALRASSAAPRALRRGEQALVFRLGPHARGHVALHGDEVRDWRARVRRLPRIPGTHRGDVPVDHVLAAVLPVVHGLPREPLAPRELTAQPVQHGAIGVRPLQ
jgi:hypothetical protein